MKTLSIIPLKNYKLVLEYKDIEKNIDDKIIKLEQQIYEVYLKDSKSFHWLFILGFTESELFFEPSVQYFARFANKFIKNLRLTANLEEIRDKVDLKLTDYLKNEFINQLPLAEEFENINEEFLDFIWQELLVDFRKNIIQYQGKVSSFMHSISPELNIAGEVYFHLVENKNDKNNPFAFLATYSSSVKDSKIAHAPLGSALNKFKDNKNKLIELLAAVNRAAKNSSFIKKIVESGEIYHPLKLNIKEAYNFLKNVSNYEAAGIICRIPNWSKSKTKSRVKLTIGEKGPSKFGAESLIKSSAKMFIGDIELDEKEIKDLTLQNDGLVLIKGKWVELDKKQLNSTLENWRKAKRLVDEHNLSMSEAMNMLIASKKLKQNGIDEDIIEVSYGSWLANINKKLENPKLINNVSPLISFTGILRPYQKDGLNWLYLLKSIGFGALLADDMGLGKTIQIISFLQLVKFDSERNKQNIPNILIAPASLLPNWSHELNKFAPDIEYYIAHPNLNNDYSGKKPQYLTKYHLVITTYSLILRHVWFLEERWNYAIIDEAQAIKNANAKQSKAIKKINRQNQIALSGTPVENSASDLWSIFDFVNPGVLGTATEFSNFITSAKKDPQQYAKLRKTISPYILRRSKSDKNIISDLPDKIERKIYVNLVKQQIFLYQKLVDVIAKNLEAFGGGQIEKQGLILSSLIKFKQICNHPSQYLGIDKYNEEESGKFIYLKKICENIFAKREKLLIFTQFKEIAPFINSFLMEKFDKRGLVLDGSTSLKRRKEIVANFQNREDISHLVLSIKAGGVGLNLTEASHVIHFDRWWNPAIENQATDRAYRIGQKNKVIVHKFICINTLEEKIDEMIEEKTKLATDIIGSNGGLGSTIAKMNNQEIINLFKMKF